MTSKRSNMHGPRPVDVAPSEHQPGCPTTARVQAVEDLLLNRPQASQDAVATVESAADLRLPVDRGTALLNALAGFDDDFIAALERPGALTQPLATKCAGRIPETS